MRLRAVVLLSILATALAVTAPVASAAPLSFAPPQYIDNEYAGGEPLLFTDTIHKTMVYSSHEGTTHLYRPGVLSGSMANWILTYRNQVKIWSSKDSGKTWQRSDFVGTGATQPPSQNSGFSDPDLSQDEGGRIYNTGINLATNALFSSGDGGVTWDKGTAQCETGDRPWVMGGKAEEVFFVTNRIGPGEVLEQVMLRSIDGGNSCGGEGGPAIPNYGTWAEKDGGGSYSGNGKPYYDHVNNTVVAPITGSGKLGVSIWKRGSDKFVPKMAVEAPLYAHWPSIALDGAGTIYLTYDVITRQEGNTAGCDGDALPNASDIYYVFSKDQGETWSAPARMGATPNVRSFWPWAVAGDKGKLNITWYETDKLVDLGCQESNLTPWATTITNADDEAKRKIEPPVNVTGRPIANSNVCETGTTCVATGVDRRLGDFFSNWIDEAGCVIIGTGDTMSPDPVTGGDRNISLPLFVKQKSGPKLIGSGDCDGTAGPTVTAPDGKPVAKPAKPVRQNLGLPSTKRCVSKRAFDIRLRAPKGQRIAKATVKVAGKKVKVTKKRGRFVARVNLKGLKKSTFKVSVTLITGQGRAATDNRTYRTCSKRKK